MDEMESVMSSVANIGNVPVDVAAAAEEETVMCWRKRETVERPIGQNVLIVVRLHVATPYYHTSFIAPRQHKCL
jgi:hypothetical protein